MSDTTNKRVPSKIYEVLKDVVKADLEDFEVTIHDPNKKGEGFLGEMVFISLKNNKSGQIFDFVVKQAFTDQKIRDLHPIRNVFVNEIYFYSEIWPKFNEFQKRISAKYQFQKMPKCFATVSKENCEQIVLENLKFRDFQVHDKRKPLDKQHFELVLKEYGKFHALSFAYKALYPEDFAKLAKELLDIYSDFGEKDYFQSATLQVYQMCLDSLQPGVDDKVIEAYRTYPETCLKLFLDSIDCETKYTTILHGDCWSNNMMFSYNETGKVIDVRFLDFQLSKLGSPCCDLSYCIYSGAPKDVLQDLDHYLGVYHNSLSETLRAFGCDPEKLYPMQELKRDWKKYCKLGLTMGLMVWQVKLAFEGQIKDFQDEIVQGEDGKNNYLPNFDMDLFKKIGRDLILHLYENNYL